MSDQKLLRGGISMIWKVENFNLIPHLWKTAFSLKWAKMKSEWQMEMTFFNKELNKKLIVLQISKSDELAPLCLSGSVYAVVNTSAIELAKFVGCDFPENLNKKSIRLTPFEGIDWKEDGLVKDDVLIIRINLWDHNTNDLVAAEYFIRSSCFQQVCSYHKTLEKSDWEKKDSFYECSINDSEEFTDLFTMQKFSLKMSLCASDNNTSVRIQASDIESENFCTHCSYKLEFRCKGRSKIPFSGTDRKQIALGSECLDVTFLTTEEKWDYLTTELVVNSEIIIISDYRGIIEKIYYGTNIQNFSKDLRILKESFLKFNLQHSMYKLYTESKFCDVTLLVDEVSFFCHKAVLCARSSRFRAMLENDMEKKETNIVKIADVEPQILNRFLMYLYTDDLEEEDFDSALKLYSVAYKYDVPDLQILCANIMISNLTVDNIPEILDLTDSHEDESLRNEILSYFCEHSIDIVQSSSWKRLLLRKPYLAAETLQVAITKLSC